MKAPPQHPPGTSQALVTLFRSATDTVPLSHVEIGRILQKIREAKPPDIDELRSLYHRDRAAYDERKKKLPAVTFAGNFTGRRESTLEAHSGFIVLDLDNLEGILSELREEIEKDRYTYACFLSPSGAGLKVIVRIEAINAKEHNRCFDGLKTYYLKYFNQTIDSSGRDASRLCFLSHDPALTISETADTFPLPPVATRTKAPIRSAAIAPVPLDNGGIQSGDVAKVRHLLSFIPSRPDYDTWIKIIGAVGSVLSDADAAAILEQWSPEEKEGEYRSKLGSGIEKIGAGTLVFMAKANGYPSTTGAKISRSSARPIGEEGDTPESTSTRKKNDGPQVIRLSEVSDEPMRWLEDSRLPYDLIALTGEMGLGKSSVTVDYASRITTGRHFPSGAENTEGPRPVLFICAEDKAGDVRGRVAAAGGDLRLCHFLPVVWGEVGEEKTLSLPADLPIIEWAIEESDACLVIIDPLEALVGAIDTAKGSSVRTVTTRLAAIAHRTGAAILYLGHPPKNATTAANAFGGSKAFVNAARAVYVAGPERDVTGKETGRFVLACRKMSAARTPKSLVYRIESSIEGNDKAPPVIRWDGLTNQTADQTIVSPELTHNRPTAEDRARTAILGVLSDDETGAHELEQKVLEQKIGKIAFKNARGALASEGKIVSERRGYQGSVVWFLKPMTVC
jgi:hypothetical protein